MEVIDFSIIEVRLIQSLWEKKSIQYIANMLDRPYSIVERKVHEMNRVHQVKLYELPHFEKKIVRKKVDEEMLREKVIKVPSSAGKISVRIDSKTVVLVKPGTDVEAYKKAYLKRKNTY